MSCNSLILQGLWYVPMSENTKQNHTGILFEPRNNVFSTYLTIICLFNVKQRAVKKYLISLIP